jgi:sugar phosphate permease
MEDLVSLIQWPAFAASLIAAWLVASSSKGRRNLGFWIFLASNVLWVVWGLHTRAWALIALQVCLAALNIRGLFKTDDKK